MQGQVLQEVQRNFESAKIVLGTWGCLLTTFDLLAGTSSPLLQKLMLQVLLALLFKV